MSLLFNSRRDVSVGPTTLAATASLDKHKQAAAVAATLAAEVGMGVPACYPNRNEDESANSEIFCTALGGSGRPDASSESSSIGVPSDSEEDDDVESGPRRGREDEEQSYSNGSLSCLTSLEESLPIKRGLSSYFSGKSKSFANFAAEVISSVEDLKKKENPLNKRRRVMIAYKWSKKSSLYGWKNPTSMPLLALNEEDDIDNQKEDEVEEEEQDDSSKEEDVEEIHTFQDRKQKLKASKSCFAFTNLEN